MSRQKRKKPLTCKVCGKKFYHSAKTHPLGRLRKHIAKEHPSYHKQIVNKGKKTRQDAKQLDEELQLADDLLLGVILEMNERLERLEGQPTVHKDLMGQVIQYVKEDYQRNKAGIKPKHPARKALFGMAYRGGYKK